MYSKIYYDKIYDLVLYQIHKMKKKYVKVEYNRDRLLEKYQAQHNILKNIYKYFNQGKKVTKQKQSTYY